jgi:hypothetical protein
MNTEQQIREQAKAAQRKVEALDWLDKVAAKGEHPITCPSQDDTGWPAPCDCGYNERHRVTDYIRRLIINAP